MTEITVYTYAVPIIIALILGEAIYSNAKGLNFYKLKNNHYLFLYLMPKYKNLLFDI